MQRTLVSIAALTIPMLLGPSSLLADDGLSDGFYRYPSIGSGSIIFVSEGDLWKVPASGGTAICLTCPCQELTPP